MSAFAKKWGKSISIFVLFVFIFTLLPTNRPVEAANGTIDIPDGNYYIVNAESGKFVGLENDSAALNSRPVMTSKPTKWTIRHRNNNLQFSPYGSSFTLEVEESRLNNGALVKLFVNDFGYLCKEWKLYNAGDGSVYITNVNSGSVLDVSHGDIALDGALLWQYGCNGSAAQKYRIFPADAETWNKYINQKSVMISGGNYKIKSILANKYVDVKDGSKDWGAYTQIWENAGTLQQIYSIISHNGKGYKITPVHSGLPLEVSGSSTANGGRIQQYKWDDGYSTKIWYLVEITPGYYWIVNANSLKVMDVAGGNTANGTVVQQWELNGTTSQVFTLERDYAAAGATENNVVKTEVSLNSAKIQFIEKNKTEFIKQAKDVQSYTNQILEITGMIIGTDAWFQNLGIVTGSATLAFATAVETMATDYDNILNAATILMMCYHSDQAQFHSKELIRLLNYPITEQSGKQILQHWKDMIYCRQVVAGLSADYVDAYAKLGNASKAQRAFYFTDKYLDGAFSGALSGFNKDWGVLVNSMKTALEHGTDTLSAIKDIFQFHQSTRTANDLSRQCDEIIKKYNSL